MQTTQMLLSGGEPYRRLVEASPDLIFIVNHQHRLQYVNNHALALFGADWQKNAGRICEEYFTVTHTAPLTAGIDSVFMSGEPAVMELAVLVDQEHRWINLQLAPLHGPDSLVEAVIGVGRDLTERTTSEEALRESEARCRVLFEMATDMVLFHNLHTDDNPGYFLEVNDAVCETLGYSRAELSRMTPIDILAPESQTEIESGRLQLLAHGRSLVERILVTKSGDRIPVELHARMFEWNGQQSVLSVARDITERKRAEQSQARYAADLEERNAELDAFAHTVAHDLKNPLFTISGSIDLLTSMYDDLSPNDRCQVMAGIDRAAKKMEAIIQELLLLAHVRKSDVACTRLDMQSIVAEAIARLGHSIHEHRGAVVLCDPEEWPVALGYAPWVEEVWVNYISNALKYGGVQPCVEIGAAAEPNGMVRFFVSDHGAGLSPEQVSRLFVEFTRLDQRQTRGRGHGIGLSIVKRIVDKLGGNVVVESQVGAGSVFGFTLPAAPRR